MQYKIQKSGFTLIELLVVISIMGMLSALLVPNFMTARERARDTQRKSDLSQIQKSLELYKLDQITPAYPAASELPSPGTEWVDKVTGNVYMNKFPKDPKSTYSYVYKRDAVELTEYTVKACLENTADSDGVACPADLGLWTCTSNKCIIVKQP